MKHIYTFNLTVDSSEPDERLSDVEKKPTQTDLKDGIVSYHLWNTHLNIFI